MADRERLIVAIERAKEQSDEVGLDCIVVKFKEANIILELLKEQPQWIRVKDKLPEVGQVVLAFGTRSATTGMFQGINNRNDHWWWKGHTIKHVSHWMPLPEPPEEVKPDADD